MRVGVVPGVRGCADARGWGAGGGTDEHADADTDAHMDTGAGTDAHMDTGAGTDAGAGKCATCAECRSQPI